MRSIEGNVNWGIIGCGDVCEVKSGPAFNKVDHSKLVAVMRRDLAKAEDFASRHAVPRFYNDAAALINDEEVNAIYVATPPSTHEFYTDLALKAGKPVYVEKPVSIDAASCERMVALSDRLGAKVTVAHYRRGLPLFKKVKSLVRDGAIGKVRLIQTSTLQPAVSDIIIQTNENWRIRPEISGGGLFNDLSPHQLDIMYWIFGAPVEVSGLSINQAKQYDAPDLTTMIAVFPKEICFNGIWAFNVAQDAASEICEVIGDKGKLRFSFFRKSTLEVITENDTQVLEMDYPENIQQPMIDAVVKYFRGQGPNPCSLDEALEVMRMIDKVR